MLALCVDHGLHPDSPVWTRRAAETARRLGADWRGLAWTGPKPEAGLAAAARAARHALLADAAREAGARVILTGHTRDDVLESRRMRAEGASVPDPRPWSPSPAWPQGRGLMLLRPLLAERRADLRAWLAARALDWLEDPANADPRHHRARARAALASEAEEAGGSGSERDEAGVTADIMTLARGAGHEAGSILLSVPLLRRARPEAARRVLAAACLSAAGTSTPPRSEGLNLHLRGVCESGAETARNRGSLAGARLERGDEIVRLCREPGEWRRVGAPVLTLTPGRPAVFDGRFELTALSSPETVVPATGSQSLLAHSDRMRLKPYVPAVRAGSPVLLGRAPGEAALSALWPSERLAVKSLAAQRFAAACGLIAHEADLVEESRGAAPVASLCSLSHQRPHPSGAEGRGWNEPA